MKLKDKRLLLCAQLCDGDFVCDIGTDHGYLPAYLVSEGKCSRAIAADINQMPLDAAKATFAQAGISDKAEFYLSDGLKNVPLDEVTDIVIAGMGGELIARILDDDSRCKECGANFILQPMTRASVLRKYLYENGYEITCEKAAENGRFIYTVIKCRYTGNCRTPDIAEENLGLLSPENETDMLYIKKHIERISNAARGMEKNSPEKAAELYEIEKALRNHINREKE